MAIKIICDSLRRQIEKEEGDNDITVMFIFTFKTVVWQDNPPSL